MSKSARKRKHDTKMARKRVAKAARKAAYKALAGTSKRRKRQTQKTGPTSIKGMHAMANCGNIGCARCFPQFNPPSNNLIAHQLKVKRELEAA